jgi:hypothetical protein
MSRTLCLIVLSSLLVCVTPRRRVLCFQGEKLVNGKCELIQLSSLNINSVNLQAIGASSFCPEGQIYIPNNPNPCRKKRPFR